MKVYTVIEDVIYGGSGRPASGTIRIVYKGEMDKLPVDVPYNSRDTERTYIVTNYSSLQKAREYYQSVQMNWSRESHNITFIDDI